MSILAGKKALTWHTVGSVTSVEILSRGGGDDGEDEEGGNDDLHCWLVGLGFGVGLVVEWLQERWMPLYGILSRLIYPMRRTSGTLSQRKKRSGCSIGEAL